MIRTKNMTLKAPSHFRTMAALETFPIRKMDTREKRICEYAYIYVYIYMYIAELSIHKLKN